MRKTSEMQLDFLKSFRKQKLLSANKQKNIIFSGSGDSLASSLLAESMSDGVVRGNGSIGPVS